MRLASSSWHSPCPDHEPHPLGHRDRRGDHGVIADRHQPAPQRGSAACHFTVHTHHRTAPDRPRADTPRWDKHWLFPIWRPLRRMSAKAERFSDIKYMTHRLKSATAASPPAGPHTPPKAGGRPLHSRAKLPKAKASTGFDQDAWLALLAEQRLRIADAAGVHPSKVSIRIGH